MASDKEPLQYLEQRVKYYEGKIKLMDKMILNPDIVKRYGVDVIMNSSDFYYKRLNQFKEAVLKLTI